MKKVKEKKERDIFFILLVVLLIIVTIVVAVVILVNGKNMDVNDSEIKDLHNYFSTENLSNCNGLFTYADEKIEYKDINLEDKLCLAYYKTDLKNTETENYKPKKKEKTCKVDDMVFRVNEDSNECSVTKISKTLLGDTYYKLFGKKIEDSESFNVDGLHICYLKDDTYYCGLSETSSYTFGNDSTIYRIINRALKKGNRITIYDYFARINANNCYSTYTKDLVNDKCTKNIGSAKKVDYQFMEKYGIKYKHIFEKDEKGTYHWVSSEPITKLS